MTVGNTLWLRRLLPPANTASLAERVRASGGALCGLALAAAIVAFLYAQLGLPAMLIAPLGASPCCCFACPPVRWRSRGR